MSERLPDGIIENIENVGSSIYAKYVYHLRFDKRTGKTVCECTSYKFRGWCHHTKEFHSVLEKISFKGEGKCQKKMEK